MNDNRNDSHFLEKKHLFLAFNKQKNGFSKQSSSFKV